MRREHLRKILLAIFALSLVASSSACDREQRNQEKFSAPAGYYATLEITEGSKLYRFGPFVGYYFRPQDPQDLHTLDFLCFNEQGFYTRDLPENTLLFSGNAVLADLPATVFKKPDGKARIIPVFEELIPSQWSSTRPETQAEYRHFHSVHDDRGAAMKGYWLRHVGEAQFTYDMGGRVGQDSPLYHQVRAGVDLQFPFIVEFDQGQSSGE